MLPISGEEAPMDRTTASIQKLSGWLQKSVKTCRDVAPTRQQVANKFNYERCKAILQVAREKEPFLLIFISKNIGRLVHEYGQKIIGLDGIYKWNRMRWPVWIMVVEDKKGHSWPIAFFFAAADTAAILYKALQILLCQFHLMKTWTDNINDHCRSHPGMS